MGKKLRKFLGAEERGQFGVEPLPRVQENVKLKIQSLWMKLLSFLTCQQEGRRLTWLKNVSGLFSCMKLIVLIIGGYILEQFGRSNGFDDGGV